MIGAGLLNVHRGLLEQELLTASACGAASFFSAPLPYYLKTVGPLRQAPGAKSVNAQPLSNGHALGLPLQTRDQILVNIMDIRVAIT
jgi:hypothetical protein